MEADHTGTRFLDHRAEGLVKRRARAGWDRRCRIDAELAIVGLQPLAPARLARVAERGRLVAEEIEIDRLGTGSAEFRNLLVRLLGIERRERQRAKPAGFRH